MSSRLIGLVYETFETYPQRDGDPVDAHVEFEPESTIAALVRAIEFLGHRAQRIGSPLDLLHAIRRPDDSPGAPTGLARLDAVLNIAEGFGSRNREGWVPSLLEMAEIPCLGSDALSLSLTLDKAWANRWAAAGGLHVAAQCLIESAAEAHSIPLPAAFPLFVKPRWEGTSKGIRPSSRVETREELAREVARIVKDYQQAALVEAFVPGAELTVSLVGNDPVEVLPVVQRALERDSRIGLHALEGPGATPEAARYEHDVVAVLDSELEERLAREARTAFDLFECRDFARVDFRLDEQGEPVFLEINPLPTFATDGTFAILAELEGIPLDAMLARCIRAGLDRMGLA